MDRSSSCRAHGVEAPASRTHQVATLRPEASSAREERRAASALGARTAAVGLTRFSSGAKTPRRGTAAGAAATAPLSARTLATTVALTLSAPAPVEVSLAGAGDEYSIKNDEQSITKDEFCILNDEYSIKSDKFCIKTDGFWSRTATADRAATDCVRLYIIKSFM